MNEVFGWLVIGIKVNLDLEWHSRSGAYFHYLYTLLKTFGSGTWLEQIKF